MPYLKTYNLFVSHAWRYDDDYNRFVDLLKSANNFKYRNYSVPEHDPVDTNQLVEELKQQIRPVNIMILLAGVYASHSDWIQWELDFAKSINKPIIAIKPWGNVNVSQSAYQYASEIVGWNTNSILNAIRQYSL